MRDFPSSASNRALWAVMCLAALLRFWGIWHGYPFSYYPDEAHFVKRALSFGSGDLNPHWFHKPALYMYLLFFEYGLFFLAGKLAGAWQSVADFAVYYLKNPGAFYLIGRLTTAMFGLGTVWFTYLLGSRHFGRRAGTAGALLLALSYGHISSSQDIKADVPCTFFIVLSTLFLMEYFRSSNARPLLCAGFLAGMGTATKGYALLMVPVILTTVFIRLLHARYNLQRILVTGTLHGVAMSAAVALAFFLFSPYNLLDPMGRDASFSPFVKLTARIASVLGGEPSSNPHDFIGLRMGVTDGALDYAANMASFSGMGFPILFLGVAGSLCLIGSRNAGAMVFLIYPVLFAIISVCMNPGYAEPRHQLPLYPFLSVAGGVFVGRLFDLGKTRHIPAWLIYCLIFAVLSYPAYRIVQRNRLISRTDTRNTAREWIEANIPAGSKIIADVNGPVLFMSEKQLRHILQEARASDPHGPFTAHYDSYCEFALLAARENITYEIFEIRTPWWRERYETQGIGRLVSEYDSDMGNPLKPVGVEDMEFYLRDGFEWAVVNSHKYGDFMDGGRKAENYPAISRFYKQLFAHGTLVKEFIPCNRPGPEIKIFRLEHQKTHDRDLNG